MSEEKMAGEERLRSIGEDVLSHFAENRRVLSFAEYLEVVGESPRRHLRNAAQYLRDVFDHFGEEQVPSPTGDVRRFALFDAPWDGGNGRLVGQEGVQNAIYRILSNFVRQRRVDRFILLHGPNGSSKTTITDMLARAMEHYSALPEGPLYSFSWVFPTQAVERSGIGFGTSAARQVQPEESFAHLDEAAIDARLPCEQRDHPFLLLPTRIRRVLLKDLLATEEDFTVSEYIEGGELCHKCKQIYEALLNAYEGDYLRLLRHVQIHRFFVSRRYRVAAERVEPQLAVDAHTRQVTADRSLSSLPATLQSISLHEADGELVRANRGLVDFADLFKRPIEAFKYLLSAVEDCRVSLDQANLFFDTVFIGSANETHLNAFMESPEWMSFKARMELVRVPYLLDHQREREIYRQQVTEKEAGKHIAPHATGVAALWAVLTRMHRPALGRYEDPVRDLVAKLTPRDKLHLYSERRLPPGLAEDGRKTLRAAIAEIYRETERDIVYEGRTGASPREVRTAIMNAAQNPTFKCLTAEAVLKELEALVQEVSVYDFLRQEVQGPGYADHKGFIKIARQWYLERADEHLHAAMGLVEESRYEELFRRYVTHVTHHVRKEKLRNPVTGKFDDPDPRLMADVEKTLRVEGDAEEFRQGLMTKIGAWSVDHPEEKPDYTRIFAKHFESLRDEYYAQQRRRVRRLLDNALQVLADEKPSLSAEDVAQAREVVDRLIADHGYCKHCAWEAVTMLARHRYND